MTTSWPRILLLYAIGVLAAAQLGIVPPLVPALQHELGLSLATAGLAVSARHAGRRAGRPAGRRLVRTGGSRARCRSSASWSWPAAAACFAPTADDAILAAGRTRPGRHRLSPRGRGRAIAHGDVRGTAASISPSRCRSGAPSCRSASRSLGPGDGHGWRTSAGWRLIFAVDCALLAGAMLIGALVMAHTPAAAPGHRTSRAGLAAPPPCRRPYPSSVSRCFSSPSPGSCPPIWSSIAGCRPRPPAASSPPPRPSGSPAALPPAG